MQYPPLLLLGLFPALIASDPSYHWGGLFCAGLVTGAQGSFWDGISSGFTHVGLGLGAFGSKVREVFPQIFQTGGSEWRAAGYNFSQGFGALGYEIVQIFGFETPTTPTPTSATTPTSSSPTVSTGSSSSRRRRGLPVWVVPGGTSSSAGAAFADAGSGERPGGWGQFLLLILLFIPTYILLLLILVRIRWVRKAIFAYMLRYIPVMDAVLPSSRACYVPDLETIMFGNCCNETDIIWCSARFCWTAPGCAVCTAEAGCWTSIGSGVSLYPAAHTSEARRLSMELFGAVGWAGVLAEGLGLGEAYAGAVVTGVFLVGSTGHPDLACANITCSQTGTTWWHATAPTIANLWEFLQMLPRGVWALLETMPLVFGSLLLFYLCCGRWVQVVLLVLAVPGALAQTPTPPENDCRIGGNGSPVLRCGPEHFKHSNSTCDCPFGLIIRRFNKTLDPHLDFNASCPESFMGGDRYWWTCGWGSWWWQHNNVERPYSHPYMPPDPFSAICYVTTNRSVLYNSSLFVHKLYGDGFYPNYTLSQLGPEPISTCMLDRRPSMCGDCFGGCFYQDGQHNRGFDVCGGGVRDGPWFFVPLATLRLSAPESWRKPTLSLGELLAGKYRHGFGCGISHGLINCWLCNVSLTYTSGIHVPENLWFPLPGKPYRLCINPQFARRHLPTPPNWLAMIQAASDVIFGKGRCVHHPGWYPVCKHGAWYPPDGGFVVIAADSQLFDTSPAVLRGFLGLYVALLVYMATAGARVVPSLVVLLAVATAVHGACYLGCEEAWCNTFFCFAYNCIANVSGSLCFPLRPWLAVCENGDQVPETVLANLPVTYSVFYLLETSGLPAAPWLWTFYQGMQPVEWVGPSQIFCGDPKPTGIAVSGADWWWTVFAVLTSLAGGALYKIASLVAASGVLRMRTSFPYRLFILAIHQASMSFLDFTLVGACAWVLFDAFHPVEGALSRAVVAGPALGWAWRLPTWVECFLATLCVIAYMGVAGRVRMAALVAYKLSRGMMGFALLAFLFHRGPDRGVLGSELCIPMIEADLSVDAVWWYLAVVFSFSVVSLTLMNNLGKKVKIRIYARWCKLYCWLEFAVGVSPVGVFSGVRGHVSLAWLLGGVIFPIEASYVCMTLIGLAGFVDFLDWLLERILCARPNLNSTVQLANTCHAWLTDDCLRAFLRRRWARGELLYDHAGQVSGSLRDRIQRLRGCLEPVCIEPEELREVHDDMYTLTCGRWYGGKPVVARCGTSVLVGQARSVTSLPPGYRLTAPLVVVRPRMGFWKTLKVSMTGRSEVPGNGQIVQLNTALSASMGTGVSGVLYATFHGTKGRALATPQGARNPFWTSPSEDVVCYPLLSPLTSLDPCTCGDHSRWVLTHKGTIIHGTQLGEDRVSLDCPTPISDLKGASGSPVMCDRGHAVGMMVGATGRSGTGEAVRFVRPWAVRPGDVQAAKLPEFPTVPSEGFKEVPYFAPTGSGKSTKFPAKLAQDGHNVLVLNPSVVTTKAMYGYMKELTGKAPNVFAGTGKGAMQVKTGSKITYVTYGRFLVNPQGFLGGKAVVICDECHATDGTSVLGIGVARTLAQEAGVKLLVYATATPPGTQFTAHKNITERELDGEGDVPFYGLTLKSERYSKGRHLIFCHSKLECTRVAGDLASAGVKAVTYWRGKSADVLTDDADLTVVATDAISTGYTGNFATVTDCCSVVQEDVEVDLNPTFSITLYTRPADAALRMQRRGRCGRGAPGTYYQTIKGAPPSGVCSSSATWAATEAAFMWYGMEENDVTRYLVAFQDCPYTSRLPGHPADVVRVLGVLRPFFHCSEVTQEALKETSWPLLTGIQRKVCLECDAQPPSDDIRWTGIAGTSAVPLLYRLGTVANPCTSHPLALKMAAALGDTSYHDTATLGPLLLAGAAIAAGAAVADATGTLVMTASWEVSSGGAPTWPDHGSLDTGGDVQGGGPLPEGALTEVVTSLDWEWLSTVWAAVESGASSVARSGMSTAARAQDWWKVNGYPIGRSMPSGGRGAAVMGFLESHVTSILAGVAALASAGKSPVFAALAAVVAGASSVIPNSVAWLLTLAGTAAAGLIGGLTGAASVGAGFYIGTRLASLSMIDMVISCAAGYEACVNVCAFTLDIMDGKATLTNALPCLAGLLAPGAAVAGVVFAILLRGAKGTDVTVWMNRLLSMLPKSNTLPDGFFAEPRNVRLGEMVRSLSLVTRVKALCEATRSPTYTYCANGWLGRLIEFAGTVIRSLTDFVSAKVPPLLPPVPVVNCQKPYVGPWHGAGTGITVCPCGKNVTITAGPGADPVIKASKFCSSYWAGGFPINTSTNFSGTLAPNMSDATDLSLMVGFGNVIRLKKKHDGKWWIVETSLANLTTNLVLKAAARGPVESGGALVSNHVGPLLRGRFSEGQCITFDEQILRLPIIMHARITWPNMPYVPSILPEDPSDNGESIVGPCEQAVECALSIADEATAVADAVVEIAQPMLSAAMEARRKAEMEAWLLREKGLGRVSEVETPEGVVTEFMSTDECLVQAETESLDDPLLDRGITHLIMEEMDSTPVSEEPVVGDLVTPGAPEEALEVAKALKDGGRTLTYGVESAKDYVKRAARWTLRGGKDAVEAAGAITARLLHTGKATLRAVAEEDIPITDITTVRTITYAWFCEGERKEASVRTADETTVQQAAEKAGVPCDHPHVYKMGALGIMPDVTAWSLGDEAVTIVASCKKGDKARSSTVIKTIRHTCCGKDESLTKHFGRFTPIGLLGTFWAPAKGASVYDGETELKDLDIMGKVGDILDVVHETPCGLSYLWSGRPITVSEPRKPPITRPMTAFLKAKADKVYVTNPEDVHQRIAKVTIEQTTALQDEYYKDAYNLAKANANKVTSAGFDYDTAVSKVKRGSARGHVAQITVSDLKTARGKKAVMDCLDGIRTGTVKAHFMLRPKSEVFPQTKGTFKPPRLIVYPSLEFRVAEKMILGDPSIVAKAVMGKSYGFQYAPHQRAKVLVDMWASKKRPVCYTVDGTCFDSTVTPEDIRREGEIFAAASLDPQMVRLLHGHYAESPMVDPSGNIVGVRRCRASGTLTTSAGNSITCYLKVSAACRKAGLINPSFLIHGDDVLIICEKTEEDQSDALGSALASYGYACVPTRHADLTSAESCSASLDTVRTVRGLKHVLRCDMRRGLGRTMAEFGDPLGTAWGYTINYPTHPIVMYILLPLLLQVALNNGTGLDQRITVEVRGNSIEMPLKTIGKAARGLHGRDILAVTGHSATVLQETHDTLQFFGMKGLNHWRRVRRKVKLRLLRAGPEWARLARELLWDPGDSMPPDLSEGVVLIPEDFWEHAWEGATYRMESGEWNLRPWLWSGLAGVALLLMFVV